MLGSWRERRDVMGSWGRERRDAIHPYWVYGGERGEM